MQHLCPHPAASPAILCGQVPKSKSLVGQLCCANYQSLAARLNPCHAYGTCWHFLSAIVPQMCHYAICEQRACLLGTALEATAAEYFALATGQQVVRSVLWLRCCHTRCSEVAAGVRLRHTLLVARWIVPTVAGADDCVVRPIMHTEAWKLRVWQMLL